MTIRSQDQSVPKHGKQAGMTLLEVVIALGILLIVSAGLTGVAAVAVLSTENQGHLAARTAEYAQDKMEQLLSLKFSDGDSSALSGTDTISPNCVDYLTNPSCSGTEAGLAVGGSTDLAAPTDHYVDYLDATGNPLGGGATAPAGWFYMRAWSVCYLQPAGTCDTATATNLKRITVAVEVASQVASQGRAPQSFIVSLKSSVF